MTHMTDNEKCNLIEATLPRFFGSFYNTKCMFKVYRAKHGTTFPRECVVLESNNGVFNAHWVHELSLVYIMFFADGKIWLQSIRNLNLVMNAL